LCGAAKKKESQVRVKLTHGKCQTKNEQESFLSNTVFVNPGLPFSAQTPATIREHNSYHPNGRAQDCFNRYEQHLTLVDEQVGCVMLAASFPCSSTALFQVAVEARSSSSCKSRFEPPARHQRCDERLTNSCSRRFMNSARARTLPSPILAVSCALSTVNGQRSTVNGFIRPSCYSDA
jgi:hypothetical protein